MDTNNTVGYDGSRFHPGNFKTPRWLMRTHLSLRPVLYAGVGNLVAVATAVRRHVFSIIEIATSLDKLGMILRRAQDERKILAMTD